MTSTLRNAALPRWFIAGATIASIIVAVLLNKLTKISGTAGTAIVAALVFLVIQTTASFRVEGRRHAVDRLSTTFIYATFIAAATPMISVLFQVVTKGVKALDIDFLTHSMRSISPLHEGGGAYHAILGTLEQVGIATVIAVPLGILTALYLVEYSGTGRLGRWISFFVDVMTGVPSIVSGLFIYTAWILVAGFDRSGSAAALALTILMIPVVVRTTEEMLRLVPNDLREASLALGIPKWKTILKVVLPTAIGGILTGVMLAIARVSGETAPLLLTTFLSQSINSDPFNGPQAALPTFIWDQFSSATQPSVDRAWAGALVLILLVMVFYGTAKLLARYYAPKAQ